MRAINEIVVHSSATRARTDIGVVEIRGWHQNDNGWSDVGYHEVIRRDGGVEPGRPLRLAGAHVGGRNTNTIGICMVGGVADDNRTPEDNFTDAQWKSLAMRLADLLHTFPNATVHGHRDFAATACPSTDVPGWWASRLPADIPYDSTCSAHYDPTEPYNPDDYLEMSSRISSLLVWVQGLFKKWSV